MWFYSESFYFAIVKAQEASVNNTHQQDRVL